MADPGLTITGQGGRGGGVGKGMRSPRPSEMRKGGLRPNKFFFRPLGPQFGLKIRGGGLCTIPKEQFYKI